MNTNSNNNNGRNGRSRRRPILIGIGILGIAVGAIALWPFMGLGAQADVFGPLAEVRSGPLTISVTESGTIANRDQIVLRSQVEGTTTILWIIEEGSQVGAGDLLVELDSSRLVDQHSQQQITVLNAEASFIRARENLEVARSQTQSDIERADLTVRFAELDLEKYINGEYPQQVQQAEADITLARQELERANDQLEGSRRLAEQEYITRLELQADTLAARRRSLDLELAEQRLDLLRTYTHPRRLEQLQSDVSQAKASLERTIRRAQADMVQAEADLTARRSEFERQQAQLTKLADQIEKCRIVAPVAGMVVYATTGQGGFRGNVEPLDLGTQVRERMELIRLPTTSSMMANVKVHESSLQKITRGLPARITVDALPGRTFTGRVNRIGLLPDAQSIWMNPDLKVYDTEVIIHGDGSELRPGMTCRVEIIVEEHPDALHVPISAVVRAAGRPVVYVPGPDSEPRMVQIRIGLDNNRFVHVLDGLEIGQRVMLNPPLTGSDVPWDETEQTGEIPPAEENARPSGEEAERPQLPFDPAQLRNMTPEQRQQLMESLTPEQRRQLEQLRGGRSRGGAPAPADPIPGGGPGGGSGAGGGGMGGGSGRGMGGGGN